MRPESKSCTRSLRPPDKAFQPTRETLAALRGKLSGGAAEGKRWALKKFSVKIVKMPRKIRELILDLKAAGFYEIMGAGKGSHRKFTHAKYSGAVTLSGKAGEDAKHYQERQVKQAIESVKQ